MPNLPSWSEEEYLARLGYDTSEPDLSMAPPTEKDWLTRRHGEAGDEPWEPDFWTGLKARLSRFGQGRYGEAFDFGEKVRLPEEEQGTGLSRLISHAPGAGLVEAPLNVARGITGGAANAIYRKLQGLDEAAPFDIPTALSTRLKGISGYRMFPTPAFAGKAEEHEAKMAAQEEEAKRLYEQAKVAWRAGKQDEAQQLLEEMRLKGGFRGAMARTAGGLLMDPLTYGALGLLGRGKAATAATQMVQPYFAATMGAGVVEGGKKFVEAAQEHGISSPEAMTELPEILASGAFLGLMGKHAIDRARLRPDIQSAAKQAVEDQPAAKAARAAEELRQAAQGIQPTEPTDVMREFPTEPGTVEQKQRVYNLVDQVLRRAQEKINSGELAGEGVPSWWKDPVPLDIVLLDGRTTTLADGTPYTFQGRGGRHGNTVYLTPEAWMGILQARDAYDATWRAIDFGTHEGSHVRDLSRPPITTDPVTGRPVAPEEAKAAQAGGHSRGELYSDDMKDTQQVFAEWALKESLRQDPQLIAFAKGLQERELLQPHLLPASDRAMSSGSYPRGIEIMARRLAGVEAPREAELAYSEAPLLPAFEGAAPPMPVVPSSGDVAEAGVFRRIVESLKGGWGKQKKEAEAAGVGDPRFARALKAEGIQTEPLEVKPPPFRLGVRATYAPEALPQLGEKARALLGQRQKVQAPNVNVETPTYPYLREYIKRLRGGDRSRFKGWEHVLAEVETVLAREGGSKKILSRYGVGPRDLEPLLNNLNQARHAMIRAGRPADANKLLDRMRKVSMKARRAFGTNVRLEKVEAGTAAPRTAQAQVAMEEGAGRPPSARETRRAERMTRRMAKFAGKMEAKDLGAREATSLASEFIHKVKVLRRLKRGSSDTVFASAIDDAYRAAQKLQTRMAALTPEQRNKVVEWGEAFSKAATQATRKGEAPPKLEVREKIAPEVEIVVEEAGRFGKKRKRELKPGEPPPQKSLGEAAKLRASRKSKRFNASQQEKQRRLGKLRRALDALAMQERKYETRPAVVYDPQTGELVRQNVAGLEPDLYLEGRTVGQHKRDLEARKKFLAQTEARGLVERPEPKPYKKPEVMNLPPERERGTLRQHIRSRLEQIATLKQRLLRARKEREERAKVAPETRDAKVARVRKELGEKEIARFIEMRKAGEKVGNKRRARAAKLAAKAKNRKPLVVQPPPKWEAPAKPRLSTEEIPSASLQSGTYTDVRGVEIGGKRVKGPVRVKIENISFDLGKWIQGVRRRLTNEHTHEAQAAELSADKAALDRLVEHLNAVLSGKERTLRVSDTSLKAYGFRASTRQLIHNIWFQGISKTYKDAKGNTQVRPVKNRIAQLKGMAENFLRHEIWDTVGKQRLEVKTPEGEHVRTDLEITQVPTTKEGKPIHQRLATKGGALLNLREAILRNLDKAGKVGNLMKDYVKQLRPGIQNMATDRERLVPWGGRREDKTWTVDVEYQAGKETLKDVEILDSYENVIKRVAQTTGLDEGLLRTRLLRWKHDIRPFPGAERRSRTSFTEAMLTLGNKLRKRVEIMDKHGTAKRSTALTERRAKYKEIADLFDADKIKITSARAKHNVLDVTQLLKRLQEGEEVTLPPTEYHSYEMGRGTPSTINPTKPSPEPVGRTGQRLSHGPAKEISREKRALPATGSTAAGRILAGIQQEGGAQVARVNEIKGRGLRKRKPLEGEPPKVLGTRTSKWEKMGKPSGEELPARGVLESADFPVGPRKRVRGEGRKVSRAVVAEMEALEKIDEGTLRRLAEKEVAEPTTMFREIVGTLGLDRDGSNKTARLHTKRALYNRERAAARRKGGVEGEKAWIKENPYSKFRPELIMDDFFESKDAMDVYEEMLRGETSAAGMRGVAGEYYIDFAKLRSYREHLIEGEMDNLRAEWEDAIAKKYEGKEEEKAEPAIRPLPGEMSPKTKEFIASAKPEFGTLQEITKWVDAHAKLGDILEQDKTTAIEKLRKQMVSRQEIAQRKVPERKLSTAAMIREPGWWKKEKPKTTFVSGKAKAEARLAGEDVEEAGRFRRREEEAAPEAEYTTIPGRVLDFLAATASAKGFAKRVRQRSATQEGAVRRLNTALTWANMGRPARTGLDISAPFRNTFHLTQEQVFNDMVRLGKSLAQAPFKGRKAFEPVETSFRKNLWDTLKVFASSRVHEALSDVLENDFFYELGRKYGVRYATESDQLENFIGAEPLHRVLNWTAERAKELPLGTGKPVSGLVRSIDFLIKASERSYNYYINKTMRDAFKAGVEGFAGAGEFEEGKPMAASRDWHEEILKDLAHSVTTLASRTKVGEGVIPKRFTTMTNTLLSGVFYSAQMQFARMKWLGSALSVANVRPMLEGEKATVSMGPGMEIKFNFHKSGKTLAVGPGFTNYSSPQMRHFMRMNAVKSLSAAAGLMGMVYTIYKMMGEEPKVERDPRSSDFGKVRISPAVAFDGWGGLQQLVRTGAQLATHERKEVSTGRITSQSVSDTLGKYLRSKLAPGPGIMWDYLEGRTTTGMSFEPRKDPVGAATLALVNMFAPMSVEDSLNLTQEDPRYGLLIPLMIMGNGVSAGQGAREKWLDVRPGLRAESREVMRELREEGVTGPRLSHRVTLPGQDIYGRRNYYNMTPAEVAEFEKEYMPLVVGLLYQYINSPYYKNSPARLRPRLLTQRVMELNKLYGATNQKKSEYYQRKPSNRLAGKAAEEAEEEMEMKELEERRRAGSGKGERF